MRRRPYRSARLSRLRRLGAVAVVAIVLLSAGAVAGLGLGRLGAVAFDDGPSSRTLAAIDRGRPATRSSSRAAPAEPARPGARRLWQAYPLDASPPSTR